MATKTRKRLLLVGGIVLALSFLLFNYKQRDSYRCQICFANKDVFQWRLGGWGEASIPLTPSWERVTETRFQHDFFSTNHIHHWVFAQGSPYYFFGTMWGGCAIGGGRRAGDLFQMYEHDEEFRAFISQKIREGSLTNFAELATVPRMSEPSPLRKDADALLEKFASR